MTDRDTLRAVMKCMNPPNPADQRMSELETRLRLISNVARRAIDRHPRSRTLHEMSFIQEMADV